MCCCGTHQLTRPSRLASYLERHELWRAKCNLMADMLDLSNLDPHMLMIVFLPTLLFESAFAMDIAFFYSQVDPAQIPLRSRPDPTAVVSGVPHFLGFWPFPWILAYPIPNPYSLLPADWLPSHLPY